MSEFASLAISAATIIPKSIALLSFSAVSFLGKQLVTAMGKPALAAISTEASLFKGPAQLSLVFDGRVAAATVTR
jgi:hypothetical protein